MPLVVGVAFQPVTKVYYFDPDGNTDLVADDYVIVETSRGRTMGKVVFAPKEVPASEITGPLKPIVRRATAPDMVQADQASHQEDEALKLCRERTEALKLNMKVVKAEYSYDGNSLVVYFTSEQRIDFRSLVHDISQALHTRVEMRQVGVRDHAKFVGGYGKCGRPLCCSTWLREFEPVSIKMAKQQDLPLNASEVSGLCGRLLCCLSYENDFYTEARKQMPRMNSIIETPEGPGKVRQIHVLASSVTVLVEGLNETRQMVEVPVPEPVFGDSVSDSGTPRKGAGKTERLAAVEDEEDKTNNEALTDSVKGSSPTRARPGGSARRSRGRSRKR
jgi:cell fate regulator YaaT (PSP1 superfamily)